MSTERKKEIDPKVLEELLARVGNLEKRESDLLSQIENTPGGKEALAKKLQESSAEKTEPSAPAVSTAPLVKQEEKPEPAPASSALIHIPKEKNAPVSPLFGLTRIQKEKTDENQKYVDRLYFEGDGKNGTTYHIDKVVGKTAHFIIVSQMKNGEPTQKVGTGFDIPLSRLKEEIASGKYVRLDGTDNPFEDEVAHAQVEQALALLKRKRIEEYGEEKNFKIKEEGITKSELPFFYDKEKIFERMKEILTKDLRPTSKDLADFAARRLKGDDKQPEDKQFFTKYVKELEREFGNGWDAKREKGKQENGPRKIGDILNVEYRDEEGEIRTIDFRVFGYEDEGKTLVLTYYGTLLRRPAKNFTEEKIFEENELFPEGKTTETRGPKPVKKTEAKAESKELAELDKRLIEVVNALHKKEAERAKKYERIAEIEKELSLLMNGGDEKKTDEKKSDPKSEEKKPITARSILQRKDDLLEFINGNKKPEGIAAKKTDIENRRQEELNNLGKDYKEALAILEKSTANSVGEANTTNNAVLNFIPGTIENGKDWLREKISAANSQFFKDQINAKYDAELTALENSSEPVKEDKQPVQTKPENLQMTDIEIINSLDENNYIESQPNLTKFGQERARGEGKQEAIERVRKMAQMSFDYLDGKISARKYLQSDPYHYTDQNDEEGFKKYAETESQYFKKLRESKKQIVKETPGVPDAADLESKRVDIEKRREQELEENYKQDLNFALKNYPPNYLETVSGKNFKKIFDAQHPEREKLVIDGINFKYDAELAALGLKPEERKSTPVTKKQEETQTAAEKEAESFVTMVHKELPEADPAIFENRVEEILGWIERSAGVDIDKKRKQLPFHILPFLDLYKEIDHSIYVAKNGWSTPEEIKNSLSKYKDDLSRLNSKIYTHGIEVLNKKIQTLADIKIEEKKIEPDLESKREDVERRRKEELGAKLGADIYDKVQNGITLKGGEELVWGSYIDEINAKYDAELTELGLSPQPERTKVKLELEKTEPPQESKKDIEPLTKEQLKIEIEKVIKKFAEKLKEKNVAYKDLDITKTSRGLHLVAHLTGTGSGVTGKLKAVAAGNPDFIADLASVDGKIIVLSHKLEANAVVNALVNPQEIEKFARSIGEEVKNYIEEDRKKKVARLDIEGETLKITYA